MLGIPNNHAFEIIFELSKFTVINHTFLFQLVLPEYILHILFNVLFAASGEWLALCLNIPLIAYHIKRYYSRPVMSGPGLYDPTSIMNADVLTRCQREGWIKLAFYLLSFFYYLYGYVIALERAHEHT